VKDLGHKLLAMLLCVFRPCLSQFWLLFLNPKSSTMPHLSVVRDCTTVCYDARSENALHSNMYTCTRMTVIVTIPVVETKEETTGFKYLVALTVKKKRRLGSADSFQYKKSLYFHSKRI
jgi:hypothetical protein